ncbi:MAG: serine/threonine-protein kinase [Verrucomicrobia bacterium]|nr:serine/threonine-protein kinase [Verrucomicrobiota bacterium]
MPHGFVTPSVAELNRVLHGYEALKFIGAGGMGAVYQAQQVQLERIVALKLLPVAPGGADPEFAERFRREALAMARLNHPNIVTVHDFGETTDGRFFLVMEFVEGTNLEHLIRSGQVTPAQALAIIPQICEGLQNAHASGIVHRDIKPANILIDTRGTVKITDFGLAKILDGERSGYYTLTLDERTLGTFDYMAPEQMAFGGEVDHRADIYSLGVVFYELLTGQLPRGVFDPPSRKVSIDIRLDEIVLRAMQSEPSKRFQRIAEIKTRVEEISGVVSLPSARAAAPKLSRVPLEPGHAPVPGSPLVLVVLRFVSQACRKKPVVIGGLVAVLVIAGVLVGIWVPGGNPPPGAPVAVAKVPIILQCNLLAQRQQADGKIEAFPIVDGATLLSDDQFRVFAETDSDCHLYVINVDGTGRAARLYPDTQAAQSSRVEAGQPVTLPDNRAKWFQLDAQPGTETVYLIASGEPVPELEDLAVSTAADNLIGMLDDWPRGIVQAAGYGSSHQTVLSSGATKEVPLNRILAVGGNCVVRFTFKHADMRQPANENQRPEQQ